MGESEATAPAVIDTPVIVAGGILFWPLVLVSILRHYGEPWRQSPPRQWWYIVGAGMCLWALVLHLLPAPPGVLPV